MKAGMPAMRMALRIILFLLLHRGWLRNLQRPYGNPIPPIRGVGWYEFLQAVCCIHGKAAMPFLGGNQQHAGNKRGQTCKKRVVPE
jgi:hypothetical protein